MRNRWPGQTLGPTRILLYLWIYFSLALALWEKKCNAICNAHDLEQAYQSHWWLLYTHGTISFWKLHQEKGNIEYRCIPSALRPVLHNEKAFNFRAYYIFFYQFRRLDTYISWNGNACGAFLKRFHHLGWIESYYSRFGSVPRKVEIVTYSGWKCVSHITVSVLEIFLYRRRINGRCL